MTFLDTALDLASRGFHVFPLKPRDKFPIVAGGFKAATRDPEQIALWWKRNPDANIGIACEASNLCVVDCDHGFTCFADVETWCQRNGLPATYAVRSGRRPEFGVQIYYHGAIPGMKFELDGVRGDIKSIGGLVVSPPSIHPDSGEAYQILCNAVMQDTPSVIRNLKKVIEAKPATADGLILENRNQALASILGKFRHHTKPTPTEGMALAYLLAYNSEHCADPLPEDEVTQIVSRSFQLYPDAEETPEVTIGGKVPKAATVEVDTSEDDESPAASKVLPDYPRHAWAGTVYADFAEACVQRNFIPWEFFAECLRTITGAIVGDKLKSEMYGVSPRAFTVQIGGPGSGKGTSEEWAQSVYEEGWDGLVRTNAALLFGPSDRPWRGTGIGAQVGNPASAPGMMQLIAPRQLKKGEQRDPLEIWKPVPRIITIQEELRGMFSNFANETTGAGLESAICELFDREMFSATATKTRQPERGKMHYSILGGITPEMWESVFSKASSTDSGFLTRVNIIGTQVDKRVSGLRIPNLDSIRRKLYPLIQDLAENQKVLNATPDAEQTIDKWFSKLTLPEGVQISRLNIHAWRASLHMAWLRGHPDITAEDAEGGILLAEYQAKMREFYKPPEGETRQARCEQAIRKVIGMAKRMKFHELKRKTNYTRVGIVQWEKSLKALVDCGEVRVQDEALGNGKTAKTVILLKRKT